MIITFIVMIMIIMMLLIIMIKITSIIAILLLVFELSLTVVEKGLTCSVAKNAFWFIMSIVGLLWQCGNTQILVPIPGV